MKRCAIIGGGISGLAAAYYLQKFRPDIQIDLYEANSRLGGVIKTETIDDCIVEAGPDSFLTQKKSAIELCHELGLGPSLTGSKDSARQTFLFKDEQLISIPAGLFLMVPSRIGPFLKTSLLSWPGKFAAVADLFSLPVKEDVSVAEFIEDRFGLEVLGTIAEPLLAGIYGADVQRLSLEASLPQIWAAQKHGSLILAMSGQSRTGNPPPLFTTLAGGMETLVAAIIANCPEVKAKLSSPVTNVSKHNGQWKIDTELYDLLVIATSQIPQIQSASSEVHSLISGVRKNSAIVVVFCFENLKREGFGWLVPADERRTVLACTYVNNKFSGRAPDNRLLTRIFIGGVQATEWLQRSDDEIKAEVQLELRRIASIDVNPVFSRIFRWNRAMPEYAVGHRNLINRVERLLQQEKTLFLTGNLYNGVGIPDCISHARKIAEAIAKT